VSDPVPRPFIIIGENIHATRVVSRSGKNVATDGAGEWIVFRDANGADRRLPVPEWHAATDEHVSGRLKHVGIAIRTGMAGGADAEDALAYLRSLTDRQVRAGAAFLDVNVDELSPMLADQKAAMRWLVEQVQGWTAVPISVDSSHPEIIKEGLDACRPGSRPMLNSASLERRDAVGMAVEIGGPIVVTAAGAAGMPSDVEERVTNASRMVEAAYAAGIEAGDVFIDPLIFPISVDDAFGSHALDAIAELRRRFGPDIHITGGMSNVSFGIPARKLINEAFLKLATDLDLVRSLDIDSGPHALARDAILGTDPGCRLFLKAYRAGEFADHGLVPPSRRAA
jgi:5-methyltetrahydrofolate--homocysteine methyltransferase